MIIVITMIRVENIYILLTYDYHDNGNDVKQKTLQLLEMKITVFDDNDTDQLPSVR